MLENAHYTETTYFMHRLFNYVWAVFLLVYLILAQIRGSFIIVEKNMIPVIITGIIFILIPLMFGRMIVAVTYEELVVVYGYLGWIKRSFALNNIVSTEVVTYQPIKQFGGWGIKYGKFRGEFTGCLSMHGDKGVLITLSDPRSAGFTKTNKYIIGSDEPEKLKSAIAK